MVHWSEKINVPTFMEIKMATYNTPLHDVRKSVENPVIHNVLRDLVQLGMVPDTTRMEITNMVKRTRTPDAKRTRKQKGTKSQHAYTPGESFLEVEYKKEYTRKGSTGLNQNFQYNRPIFWDMDRDIILRTQYERVSVTLNITARDDNLEYLETWLRGLRGRLRAGYSVSTHELDYSYAIEPNILDRLRSFWELSQSNFKQEDLTFDEYIEKHIHPDYKWVSANQDIEQRNIQEKQIYITGRFEGAFDTEISEDSSGVYFTTMTYKFIYDIPEIQNLQYPLLINQQLIPCEYIIYNDASGNPTFIQNGISRGFSFTGVSDRFTTIKVPNYDRSELGHYPTYYYPVIQQLISLEDKEIAFNLREVEDFKIEDATLELISKYYADDPLNVYKSPYIFTIHKNGKLLNEEYCWVDKDLNVHVNTDLDKVGVYHVSLCVLTDLNYIPWKYIENIHKHEDAAIQLVALVNEIENDDYSDRRHVELLASDLSLEVLVKNVLPIISSDILERHWPDGTIDPAKIVYRRDLQSLHHSAAVTARTVMETTIEGYTNVGNN